MTARIIDLTDRLAPHAEQTCPACGIPGAYRASGSCRRCGEHNCDYSSFCCEFGHNGEAGS